MINKPNGIEIWFPNGYGASIMVEDNKTSLPVTTGEVAVIKRTSETESQLCYDTPITNEVMPYLTGMEILQVMIKISDLPMPIDAIRGSEYD